MDTQNNFFICKSCQKEQNIDQTVHISNNYCVSCFQKEQVYCKMIAQMENYIQSLKSIKKYTKIRKNKLDDLIKLNQILLPHTIFSLTEEQIKLGLEDAQLNAIKSGLTILGENLNIKSKNLDKISIEWLDDLQSLWKYKKYPSNTQMMEIPTILKDYIDLSHLNISELKKSYSLLKKTAKIQYFTKLKNNYGFKQLDLFYFNKKYLFQTLHTYLPKIIKENSQKNQFKTFLEYLANYCQFQTIDDKLVFGIQDYVKKFKNIEMNSLMQSMLNEINASEKANLIPNISNYILEHNETIFGQWYTKLLPFDKKRFSVQNAKAMSRTDFAIELYYRYLRAEITMIKNELKNSTELKLKTNAQNRIEKLNLKENLKPEVRKEKIQKIQLKLKEDLLPKNLKILQEEQSKKASEIARYLIINVEKAFNMILTQIVEYHYKRLRIPTKVQYITNVSDSKIKSSKSDLEVYYTISSREW